MRFPRNVISGAASVFSNVWDLIGSKIINKYPTVDEVEIKLGAGKSLKVLDSSGNVRVTIKDDATQIIMDPNLDGGAKLETNGGFGFNIRNFSSGLGSLSLSGMQNFGTLQQIAKALFTAEIVGVGGLKLQGSNAIPEIEYGYENNIGGIRKEVIKEENLSLITGTIYDFGFAIPAKAKAVYVAYRINPALTGPTSIDIDWWDTVAASSIQKIVAGEDVTKNTKDAVWFNDDPTYLDNILPNITDIRVTANGGNFNGGILKIIASWLELIQIDDAL
jgi:hypothetical protein